MLDFFADPPIWAIVVAFTLGVAAALAFLKLAFSDYEGAALLILGSTCLPLMILQDKQHITFWLGAGTGAVLFIGGAILWGYAVCRFLWQALARKWPPR